MSMKITTQISESPPPSHDALERREWEVYSPSPNPNPSHFQQPDYAAQLSEYHEYHAYDDGEYDDGYGRRQSNAILVEIAQKEIEKAGHERATFLREVFAGEPEDVQDLHDLLGHEPHVWNFRKRDLVVNGQDGTTLTLRESREDGVGECVGGWRE